MKRKTLAALTCILLFSLTACGKEDKPSASIQTDGQTVVVYDNANDSSETFELINESITLEAGELLDTNVETYVRTKHPENITTEGLDEFNDKASSIQELKSFRTGDESIQTFSGIQLTKYNIKFINNATGQSRTMFVTVADTIPPKVTISSNEITVYMNEINTDGIYSWFDPNFTLNISDATVCQFYYKSDELKQKGFPADYEKKGLFYPGSIDEILVVCDEAGNETEVPITFLLTDELPPDVQ